MEDQRKALFWLRLQVLTLLAATVVGTVYVIHVW